MSKKCSGCGAYLQDNDIEKIGYIKDLNNDLCERCFRINHYNDYKKVQKDNNDFINILREINKTNDLVILVVDLFNLPHNFDQITKELKNDILLVLTKRDLLPKSVKDFKFLNYIDNYNINYVDKLIISSTKNYNFDLLMDKIKTYQKSSNVYVIGYTNAGKSTLINKIIYNYTELKSNITTSMLPSTTIDNIVIPITSELTLIDTPGIIEEGNIVNYVDETLLKKILPKKEVKPITYQVKGNQFIIVDDICKIEASNTNLTFYLSDKLKIERYYHDNTKFNDLNKKELEIKPNFDLVISGLGFIKCVNKCKLTIYIDNNIEIFMRDSLI